MTKAHDKITKTSTEINWKYTNKGLF